MENFPGLGQHQVLEVSISDSQEVGQNGVSSERIDEVIQNFSIDSVFPVFGVILVRIFFFIISNKLIIRFPQESSLEGR